MWRHSRFLARRTNTSEISEAGHAELGWDYNLRAALIAQKTPTSFGHAMRREGYVLKKTAAAD